MNFTPNELQNIVFRKTLLGFHQNQIYDVIQRVVDDYSGYIRDNGKLREKNEELQGKVQYYKSIESSLQNSLIVAQQSSEEVVGNARHQAENILEEARIKALEIVNEANRQVTDTVREKERLRRELEAFRIRAESLLKAQIQILEGYESDEPARKTGRDSLSVVGK